MKRQFSLILFLLSLSPTVFAQFIGDSYKDAKTKGKIDSIIETKYVIDIDTTDRSRFDKFVYIFNAKGQLIRSTEHAMDNYFTLITVYSYDNDGYIKEKRVNEKDKKVDTLSPASITTYTYGTLHQWVKVDSRLTSKSKPDFLTDMTDYIDLDPSGKILIDSSYYTGYSDIQRRQNYYYNSQGYLIQLTDAHGNRSLPVEKVFTYNDNGYLIKMTMNFRRRNRTGIASRFIYSYIYPKLDKMNNWLKKNEYGEGKLKNVTERRIYYSK